MGRTWHGETHRPRRPTGPALHRSARTAPSGSGTAPGRRGDGLDLVSCWPRLWFALSDAAREEVARARRRVDAAAVTAAWALPYAVAGVRWGPAGVAAAGLLLLGWRWGRVAAAEYAEIVESAVDVHTRDLATAMGVPLRSDQVTPEVGRALTHLARKGM
ncbi:hypothetical protein ABZS86_07515 [Streptomyces sp. NPDC005355]|uniref:hypothetical protein n=1 Tax=Streptomyces sp. NPDC005355 TaxID=3157038 RepID=UPI0033ABFC29